MTAEPSRSVVDRSLETCVFLPLGVALEARQLYPRLVDRGRSQVVLARLMGRYATRQARESAERLVGRTSDDAAEILRLVGVLPFDPPEAPADAPSGSPGDPANGSSPSPTLALVEPPDAEPQPEREDLGPPPDPDALAIPDYDSLAASQVVPRLDGLTPDELDAVRLYEEVVRGRKTILAKIAQLQAR